MSGAAPLFDKRPPAAAELPLTVTSGSVIVTSLFRPPPLPVVKPPLIVQASASVAATPLSTLNTRTAPPPPDHVTPATGPLIVSVPPLSFSSSWPRVSVIVCGCGEDGRVEGDQSSGAAQHIGQVDGLGRRLRSPGGRGSAVDRGIDHQSGLEPGSAPMSAVAPKAKPALIVRRTLVDRRARPDGRAAGQAKGMVWVGPP